MRAVGIYGARHIRVADGVNGNPEYVSVVEVGGIEDRAGGVELCHEGVQAARKARGATLSLKCPRGRRKVVSGNACRVGIAIGVHGDAQAVVTQTATEVGGV